MSAPASGDYLQLSTQDLLARAKDNNADAWAALYGRYRILLLYRVRAGLPRHVRLTHDSEDILQSAFLRALRQVRAEKYEYRGEGSFRRWLERIISNSTLEKIRRATLEQCIAPSRGRLAGLDWVPDMGLCPTEILSSAEEQDRLTACIEVLPEEQRQIIVMRELEAMGWDAIAEALGRANSTVRAKYRSAWIRLVRCMTAGASS